MLLLQENLSGPSDLIGTFDLPDSASNRAFFWALARTILSSVLASILSRDLYPIPRTFSNSGNFIVILDSVVRAGAASVMTAIDATAQSSSLASEAGNEARLESEAGRISFGR